jgi:hypothetical protein
MSITGSEVLSGDLLPGWLGIALSPISKSGLLVLRHENAVLRRNAGRVRYDPADRAWFAALTRFIPRRRWAEIFPVTPATSVVIGDE